MFRLTKPGALGAGIGSVLLLAVAIAAGEERSGVAYYGLGKPATNAQIAGWDIDARPDGAGLPRGQGSVMQGEELFVEKCAMCHGEFGEGVGRWPVLAGGFDTLHEDRPEKTVGSYWPYAATLWDYIHRAMPFFAPQSLTNNEVYALTAYVLYLNDLVEEDFIASGENLAAIEMPNRSGFYRDDRPDMPQVACMENCRDPDTIKITWDATALGVTPTAHFKDDPDTEAPESLATPVAAAGIAKETYDTGCAVCHASGIAGAPKTGDKSAWVERIDQGMDTLIDHAVNGYRGKTGYMPPKGGNSQLSDKDVAAAVEFMVEQSKTGDEPL